MARKRRILIIEDNETLRDSLSRAFQKKGIDVVSAGDAEEGLGVILGHLFDLILVDFKLPRNGGDTFINRSIVAALQANVSLRSALATQTNVIAVFQANA